MAMQLEYNYAHILVESGLCDGCMTFSYAINNSAWIAVPVATEDYIGKYYNPADGLFYYEPEYTTVFDPEV